MCYCVQQVVASAQDTSDTCLSSQLDLTKNLNRHYKGREGTSNQNETKESSYRPTSGTYYKHKGDAYMYYYSQAIFQKVTYQEFKVDQ